MKINEHSSCLRWTYQKNQRLTSGEFIPEMSTSWDRLKPLAKRNTHLKTLVLTHPDWSSLNGPSNAKLLALPGDIPTFHWFWPFFPIQISIHSPCPSPNLRYIQIKLLQEQLLTRVKLGSYSFWWWLYNACNPFPPKWKTTQIKLWFGIRSIHHLGVLPRYSVRTELVLFPIIFRIYQKNTHIHICK